MLSQDQSSPFSSSSSSSPACHSARKTPASTHASRLEAVVGRTVRAYARGIQGTPWAGGAEHKEDASMALQLGTRGLWHPKEWGLQGGKSGLIRSHSTSGNAPAIISDPLGWLYLL